MCLEQLMIQRGRKVGENRREKYTDLIPNNGISIGGFEEKFVPKSLIRKASDK